ncbi:2-oxo acid dehydrogenase subunit E2 [Saccharopolyspora elongata]|uniref:Dihydrolipoamide acetyltransferase component of pyruvate dehydrogenase complex n=1 Tax=Saccharopolyspora elongata TaxID=2530387 RepID=A0A4R4YYC0_9PSEU|nr:2-oxo acid dehydrogenase subunit E2 [Saccharopolyspora elongata]TDD50518.1 acyltransferase [Saccharopolyspora elongata]
MISVKLPTLNTNDASYVLVEWLAEHGSRIKKGQPLVVIETSKAQEEIDSTADGILHTLLAGGADCRPGQTVAHLFASADERHAYLSAPTVDPTARPEPATDAGLTLTKAARALADQHGLTDNELRGLGRTVIRAADIEALLPRPAQAGAPTDRQLSAQQRTVGAVVTESMRTIPAAAAYAKVDVGQAQDLARQLRQRTGSIVSLLSLLIKSVADQLPAHPSLFTRLLDDGTIQPAPCAHVAVAVDAGKGLYTPVVHNTAALSVAQIADLITGFRDKAVRGTFRADELTGANILIAPHTADGVVFATPIVFPGQTCALSLGGIDEQLVLDQRGRPEARRFTYLGLVYDHRVVNGRDAMAFLGDLKQALETPAALAAGTEGDEDAPKKACEPPT